MQIPERNAMELPAPISSRESLVLDLPPCCVQFCPAHPQYFVIGTYNLEKDEDAGDQGSETPGENSVSETRAHQNRNGSLVVYQTDGTVLMHIQTLSQPSALLDLRFHPKAEFGDILAVISSTGTLAIFKFDPDQNSASPLQQIATSRCDDLTEDILFLQCNWHPVDSHILGVTTSTGLARSLRLEKDWKIQDFVDLDVQNSIEAWCISFDPASSVIDPRKPTSVYCGGDDSTLRYNSYPLEDEEGGLLSDENSFDAAIIKGQHHAGVTAILPLSLHDASGARLVVTGSYDDHVRLFAIHDLSESYGMKRVKLLAEENLGGGVWRLDLVDIESPAELPRIRVLASCMYAGARLIELSQSPDGSWSCKILARFEEHKSMNYGCAVVPGSQGGGKGGKLTCISTSFYDKLLCLWNYDPMQ